MDKADIGIHGFMDQLKLELDSIATHWRLDLAKNENQGFAFSLWYAMLLMKSDPFLDDELGDVTLRGANDMGVDVVLTDSTNKTLVIVQAKCHGWGHRAKTIDPSIPSDFLRRHSQLADSTYIDKGSEQARELLRSYAEQVRQGWKVRLQFVTTATASERVHQDFERTNQELSAATQEIEYTLIDRDRLRTEYLRSQSLEDSIPDVVEIALPKGQHIEVPGPMPCIIATLKGNELRNQYNMKGRKEALFAHNIRNYLGDRGINRDIARTARESPENFFYFNNGITAVCKDFTLLPSNVLRIEKFQIINGAQTVGSLSGTPPQEDLRVLFRLIKTGKVSTDSGINSTIIAANNTQNEIKVSDFRSNDPIQAWLESEFSKHPRTELLGTLAYKPKRSGKRARGVDRLVQLEEFAKIRYSYLWDPNLPHADPKALWSLQVRGGQYERAFGVGDEMLPSWTNAVLHEAMISIAFHDAAKAAASAERERDGEITYMFRLRFHAVALAGIYMRTSSSAPSAKALLASKTLFNKTWQIVWEQTRRIFFDQHTTHISEGESTMFALVRSPEVWKAMQKSFRFALTLPTPKTELAR